MAKSPAMGSTTTVNKKGASSSPIPSSSNNNNTETTRTAATTTTTTQGEPSSSSSSDTKDAELLLWGSKLDTKLSALSENSSKESFQTLATWIGFHRKRGPVFVPVLNRRLQQQPQQTSSNKKKGGTAEVALSVVHQVLLLHHDDDDNNNSQDNNGTPAAEEESNKSEKKNADTSSIAEASNASPGKDTNHKNNKRTKWDKCLEFRVLLGEQVLIPNAALLKKQMASSVLNGYFKEWDTYNVFGGPTLLNEWKRSISSNTTSSTTTTTNSNNTSTKRTTTSATPTKKNDTATDKSPQPQPKEDDKKAQTKQPPASETTAATSNDTNESKDDDDAMMTDVPLPQDDDGEEEQEAPTVVTAKSTTVGSDAGPPTAAETAEVAVNRQPTGTEKQPQKQAGCEEDEAAKNAVSSSNGGESVAAAKSPSPQKTVEPSNATVSPRSTTPPVQDDNDDDPATSNSDPTTTTTTAGGSPNAATSSSSTTTAKKSGSTTTAAPSSSLVYDFESKGIPAAAVKMKELQDPCRSVATFQIARDLRNDSAQQLASLLAELPEPVRKWMQQIQDSAHRLRKEGGGGDPEKNIAAASANVLARLDSDKARDLSIQTNETALDMDIAEQLASVRIFREVIEQQRKARQLLILLLIRSRCQFGSHEAAQAFDDATHAAAELQKRKQTILDAMDLEGMELPTNNNDENDNDELDDKTRADQAEQALKEVDELSLSWSNSSKKDNSSDHQTSSKRSQDEVQPEPMTTSPQKKPRTDQ